MIASMLWGGLMGWLAGELAVGHHSPKVRAGLALAVVLLSGYFWRYL